MTACSKHPDRKAKARALCASCYQRWLVDNSAKAAATAARLAAKYARSPHGRRARNNAWARSVYGISLDERDMLAAAQAHRCAICSSDERPLFIDHCHTTGRVRGLLCNECNTLLGMAKENPDLLAAAIRYLSEDNAALKSAGLEGRTGRGRTRARKPQGP